MACASAVDAEKENPPARDKPLPDKEERFSLLFGECRDYSREPPFL